MHITVDVVNIKEIKEGNFRPVSLKTQIKLINSLGNNTTFKKLAQEDIDDLVP